jgi:hypothetical protein
LVIQAEAGRKKRRELEEEWRGVSEESPSFDPFLAEGFGARKRAVGM